MTSYQILAEFRSLLTDYEVNEISEFKTIYYLGTKRSNKLSGKTYSSNYGYDD